MNTVLGGIIKMTSASSDVLFTLRNLPPRHFEQFVADVWQERQGWTTEVMDAGPDKGLDVIGEPPNGGSKTAVQCKRYAAGNKITSRDIQQYAALRQQWQDVTGVTVVTTSSFTSDAKSLADRLDVKCIDGETLVHLIDRYGAADILEWYAEGKPRN
jgi:restriction endonuclease Mrr